MKDGYAKSKNSIYYKGMPVNFIALDNLGGTRHIDINSFQVLKNGYSKDAFHVFYKGILIIEANSKTFRLIDNFGGQFSGDRYAQDDKHIYFNGNLIENIDTSNFKLLGEGYGKDNIFVIYRGKKIPDVDIETFIVSVTDEYSDNVGGYAKDKNTAYDNGIPRKKNK
jgi:hypothetical protein